MGFLFRLTLLGVGLLFAIPSGALALALAVSLDPTLRELSGALGFVGLDLLLDEAPERAMALLAGLATGVFALVAAPPMLAALLGSVLAWRSATAYGIATGFLTALVPWVLRGGMAVPSVAEGRVTALLFLVGGLAGLVLGFFGRAGAPRREPLSGPRP